MTLWPCPTTFFTRTDRYVERELNQLSILLIRGAHIGAMFASCHIITMVWLYRSSVLVGRRVEEAFTCPLWLLPVFAAAIETALYGFTLFLWRTLRLTLKYKAGKGSNREGKKCMFSIGEGGGGRFYQALMCCLPSSPFWRESLQGHPIYIFFFLKRHYNSSHAVKARMLLLYLAQ